MKKSDYSFRRIRAVNAGRYASSISAYPGCYVRNIRLSDIDLSCLHPGTADDIETDVPEKSNHYPSYRMFGVNLPAYGLYLRHVRDISISNMRMRSADQEPRYELVADDVHNLEIDRLSTGHPDRKEPLFKYTNSTGMRVDGRPL